jgi:hypothetical protein
VLFLCERRRSRRIPGAMREQRTARHEYSRLGANRLSFVALCGGTAALGSVMIKDAAWWRFFAQVHEYSRGDANQPLFVALCGETATFGGGR